MNPFARRMRLSDTITSTNHQLKKYVVFCAYLFFCDFFLDPLLCSCFSLFGDAGSYVRFLYAPAPALRDGFDQN